MKQIKTLLLAVFAFTALTTQAEVLLVENFDYENSLSLTEANPDWYLQWGGTSNMLIVDPALEFSGYPGSNIGSALLIEGDHSNDMPHHAFTQVTEGDVFVAFLYEPTFVTKSGYFLTLRDNNISSSEFNYCGRVYAGIDENYKDIIGLRFFKKADEVFADTKLESDKTYLVVLRYHIVPGNNNDEISLYLFDSMPTKMPATPLIGPLTDAQAPDINPAHVVFRSYDDDGMVTVDGLRIATNFYEALGIDEPTDIDLFEIATPRHFETKLINGTIVVTNGIDTYNLLGTKL